MYVYTLIKSHLIQRVPRHIRVDVVRAHVVHELHGACRIARRHVPYAIRDVIEQRLAGRHLTCQSSSLTESRHTNQHVAVVVLDERRIDAQFSGSDFQVQAASERLPRMVQLFDREVTKVRLEQLLFVVAKLHVEVTVELAGFFFFGEYGQGVDALHSKFVSDWMTYIMCVYMLDILYPKHLIRWLLEHPSLSIVVRYNLHGNT